jgi:hypothetical protein
MIKIFFLLFCCCATLNVQGQTVVYSIGGNYTRLVSLEPDTRRVANVYTPAFGKSLEINFQSIPYEQYRFGFALCVDQYGGGLQTASGGLGGSTNLKLTTTKTIVSLALYPLDFQWGKHWHFQLGGLLSGLIDHQTTGSRQTTGPFTGSTNTTVPNVNNPYNIGVITSIAYFWAFKKNWSLVPKYTFYGSFNDEFLAIGTSVQATRHYLSIGIAKRLTE